MNKLIDGLFEEYRIVQNKIDKIADFELKVRGWCITLESAIIIGLMSGSLHNISRYITISFLLFIILVFQFLEQEQLETKKVLSKRAVIVERSLDRLVVSRNESELKRDSINKKVFEILGGSPRTAVYLKNAGRNRTINSFKNMFTFKNHVFYYAQYFIIVIMLVLSLFESFNLGELIYKSDNVNIKISCMKSH